MSGKRRQAEREARRRAGLERARLSAAARGLAVDKTALTLHNSLSEPDFVNRGYYVDVPFTCQSCTKSEIWTAAQQKWWYEVAKGDVFTTARYCRPCRKREREHKGEPKPYRNPGLVLGKIYSQIESMLKSAGYRPVDGKRGDTWPHVFIDYGRSGDVLTLCWDERNGRISAEILGEGQDDPRLIATTEFSGTRSSADIDLRLGTFAEAVRSFLEVLREPSPEHA